MAKTVIVGLSGGVDSTLTALLLKEQGYNVIGISMSIYNKDIPNMKLAGNACYGPEEKQDIKEIGKTCEKLGIQSYVFDCSEEYKKIVLAYFKEEYLKGRTPNPCVMCNVSMKFGLLVEKAREAGIEFDFFATGHYARIEQNVEGRFILKKGKDEKKDQSYFLYRLTQKQLSKTLFPLGNFTKEEVRQMAKERGLQVHDKPDSQDFYAGDYNDILQIPPKSGVIMMTDGKVLGTHQGFWNYTIGQRKGLGVSYPEPLFVIGLDPEKNTVYVGTFEQTLARQAHVENVYWSAFEVPPSTSFKVTAKQRSAAKASPATVTVEGDKATVVYDENQGAFTPGQSMVFYDEDTVLGGGIISS